MKKGILRTAITAMLIGACASMPVFAQSSGQVTADALHVREGNSTDHEIVGLLKKGEEVSIDSEMDNGWYRILFHGYTAYVCGDYISDTVTPVEAEAVSYTSYEESSAPEENTSSDENTHSSSWTGPVLTKQAGVVQGPSGKETYYNLDMSGVINIMRNLGYTGEYWVRNDGVKMLGDYIMCAANLNVHPRGSLVESSLGTCIVCDTGGFAYSNPNQLDIAVTW